METQEQIHPELAKAIQRYVKAGYRVINQTPTTAQLVKPKHFSLFWAVVWFLVLVVGLIIYIFYYMSKKDDIIYLQVIDDKVKVTKG